MTTIVENENFDETVYQIDLGDRVKGGPNGPANKAARNLANRTKWLKKQVETNKSDLTTRLEQEANTRALADSSHAATTATATALGHVKIGSNITVEEDGTISVSALEAPTTPDSPVRFRDLIDFPSNLAISTMGSLDLQMTIANALSTSVSSAGTPSYITDLNQSSSAAASVEGNAESAGLNYTVMRAYYNSVATAGATNGYVSLILDVAKACGLLDDKFASDGVTINSKWKGNYAINAFSALFKMREINFWDYTAQNATWEYSINMTPVTTDPDNVSYGKYLVTAQIYAAQYYHAANLGARWLGVANKYRNFQV